MPLPPQPIITRWDSWSNACVYYYNYLPQVKEIVEEFVIDGSISINAEKSIDNKNLTKYLIYADKTYDFLMKIIGNCENKTYFNMQDAINRVKLFLDIEDEASVYSYIKERIKCNGLFKIKKFENLNLSPKIYNDLLNRPATSISVERSFSMLLKLVTKEKLFKKGNVGKYMMLYYNSSTIKN